MSKEVKPGQNRFIPVTQCNGCHLHGYCDAWKSLSNEHRVILNIGTSVPPDFMLKDCPLELMPEAKLEQLKDALTGILNIVSDSDGVVGYHQNGDVAAWGEFEEIKAAEML
ncbi:hypothetical protein, partial [Vibrio parahaemolyticus]